MHRHELSIMFATLGQSAAEILVSFRYTTLFFGDFSLHFNVYINIHKYVNDTICVRLAPLNRFKVSKGAKIRNRYNQVPHLTQDTNGKVTNSQ